MSRRKRLSIRSVPALCGIAGPLILVFGDLAASFLTADYSMISDTISALALTPTGWLQTIGFLIMGLLIELFVIGLVFSIRGTRGFHTGIALLASLGFGLLLIGAFRTDPSGAPHSIEGTIHTVTAYAMSLVFPAGIVLLSPSLRGDPDWRNVFAYTLVAAVLALALTVGLFLLPAPMSWFGLYERIIVGNVIIWTEVMAIHLLQLSLKREGQPQS
jgi:hypothetical protein